MDRATLHYLDSGCCFSIWIAIAVPARLDCFVDLDLRLALLPRVSILKLLVRLTITLPALGWFGSGALLVLSQLGPVAAFLDW